MANKTDPGTIVKWISDMSDVIAKNGFFNVIKSLFVLIISIVLIWILFNPTKIFELYENYIHDKHMDAIEYRLEIDPQIQMLINDIKYQTMADRVFVLEPHNGSTNLNGLPFLYLDMRYEVVKDSITFVSGDYNNLDISRFPFINYLYNIDKWFGTMEQLGEIDKRLSMKMEINDATYLAIISLQGLHAPVGFLGITYTGDEIPDKTLIDRSLQRNGQKISSLLNGHKK